MSCLHRHTCYSERKLATAAGMTKPMWCRRNVSASPSALHECVYLHPTKTADNVSGCLTVNLDFVCLVASRNLSHRLDRHSDLDDFDRASSGLMLAETASMLTWSTWTSRLRRHRCHSTRCCTSHVASFNKLTMVSTSDRLHDRCRRIQRLHSIASWSAFSLYRRESVFGLATVNNTRLSVIIRIVQLATTG